MATKKPKPGRIVHVIEVRPDERFVPTNRVTFMLQTGATRSLSEPCDEHETEAGTNCSCAGDTLQHHVHLDELSDEGVRQAAAEAMERFEADLRTAKARVAQGGEELLGRIEL